jgi:hypothetical protein
MYVRTHERGIYPAWVMNEFGRDKSLGPLLERVNDAQHVGDSWAAAVELFHQ